MPSHDNFDRRNDKRLLTPLLLMAVVIAAAALIYTYAAHAAAFLD